MNVTASKVLLAVSLASYGYCVKDHLFTGSSSDVAKAASASGKELTAELVNQNVVLKVERDPMGSTRLEGAFESIVGATAAVAATANVPKEIGNVKLQGIMLGPNGRTAMINGVPFHEGETAPLVAGGPLIFARRVTSD